MKEKKNRKDVLDEMVPMVISWLPSVNCLSISCFSTMPSIVFFKHITLGFKKKRIT